MKWEETTVAVKNPAGAAVKQEKKLKLNKASVKEYSAVYVIGALGYSIIEIIWRGNTHWTMTLTGGVCFVLVYFTNLRMRFKKLWEKCLFGSGIITSVEFSVGCLVNLVLKWNVWDYSGMHFNILGQVCLLYSGLWFLLCVPLCGLTSFLHGVFLKKFA